MRCSESIDGVYSMMSLICRIKAHRWLDGSPSVECRLLPLSSRSMRTQDAKDTSGITAIGDGFWLTGALLRTVALRISTTVGTCFLTHNVRCPRSTMQEQIRGSRLRTGRHQKQQHVRYLLGHSLVVKGTEEGRRRFTITRGWRTFLTMIWIVQILQVHHQTIMNLKISKWIS